MHILGGERSWEWGDEAKNPDFQIPEYVPSDRINLPSWCTVPNSAPWSKSTHWGEGLGRVYISDDAKHTLPSGLSVGCTSDACVLSPHISAWWTGWYQARSDCSCHQWCGRRAPLRPHCRERGGCLESRPLDEHVFLVSEPLWPFQQVCGQLCLYLLS